ncbi:N-acetylmuramoyl-L-alanine amidase [Clostridium botulinum D/C]|uniref:N-acetylmuramoyl-L-alanine amidase n=1 Tax=Clostridium botulinum TaxID=1491 RepID=UPI001E3EDBEA|nr:N-acetylmuramoyl-L-alanine amidase [Clostridium botulinum]MCD3321823.1 N-acetylmuramoyl-L-alanine amidase [Clostridium botulinum D/C]MCD3325077.1 N-acetylmuramoyl-L-alanine amidase [Clostridium botulinum D/C]MCD3327926.1 N-acetylmuramoyl-L-alanine amidase [Clostridium botulinum D/C]
MIKGSVRGGHNYGVTGASGIVNEVTEDRKYYPLVIKELQDNGFSMQDVTPSRTSTVSQDLAYGVNLANSNGSNFFMSCHLNCYNGSAKGCEVVYSSSSGKRLAECIVSELAKLGFHNRGAKQDTRGLYELRHTKMTAVIIEPFFCDNAEDIAIYRKVGVKGIADAIVRGVCAYYGKSTYSEPPKPIFKPLPLKMAYDSPAVFVRDGFMNIAKFFYRNDLITARDEKLEYYLIDIDGIKAWIPQKATCPR